MPAIVEEDRMASLTGVSGLRVRRSESGEQAFVLKGKGIFHHS